MANKAAPGILLPFGGTDRRRPHRSLGQVCLLCRKPRWELRAMVYGVDSGGVHGVMCAPRSLNCRSMEVDGPLQEGLAYAGTWRGVLKGLAGLMSWTMWEVDDGRRVARGGRRARGENPSLSLSLSLGPGPANTMLCRCMLCHQMLLASVGTTQNQSGTGDRRSVWAFDAVISLLGRTGRPAGRIHAAKYMCACCVTTSDWAAWWQCWASSPLRSGAGG